MSSLWINLTQQIKKTFQTLLYLQWKSTQNVLLLFPPAHFLTVPLSPAPEDQTVCVNQKSFSPILRLQNTVAHIFLNK